MFAKIFNFFKELFKPKADALPAPEKILEQENIIENAENISNVENIDTDQNQDDTNFIESIKVEEKQESPELLELQNRFETNQIQVTELTDEELYALNELYARQIESLKKKIETTDIEISLTRTKIDHIVTSA